MDRNRSLAKRRADQAKSREIIADRLRRFVKRPVVSELPVGEESAKLTNGQRGKRPWAAVRVGHAAVEYKSRETNERVYLQPWTRDLVNCLLDCADQGGDALCLVWPAKLHSLSVIHALANIERIFARDLRGLRTLLWPGTYATRLALDGVLTARPLLNAFYRSLLDRRRDPTIDEVVGTSSASIFAALEALNEVELFNSRVPDPSLAELIPNFIFTPTDKSWTATTSPLERTLTKVGRLSSRKDLRTRVAGEWRLPQKAPASLMVLHYTARKEAWRAALADAALKDNRPEALLFDATQSAIRASHTVIARIPEFIQIARQSGLSDVGALIVTDDPKAFFMLRARLSELKLSPTCKVWAAEADEVLLASDAVAGDWNPVPRSNSSFKVSIVDRDASKAALTFQRLAAEVGDEKNKGYQALISACTYILRLSNLPAGYADLTAASAKIGGTDFVNQRNAWTPVKQALELELATGELSSVRPQIIKAVQMAEVLIDDWNDATPMASRLLSEVKRHAQSNRDGASIVLPSNRYVHLAHCFLERKLGAEWSAMSAKLAWHTLSSVGRSLVGDRKGKQFVFVGMTPDVVRILVTHADVPQGTSVLVAYRSAESTLKTLTRMKALEAFKAYRGRIGLLILELERRLKEVPNPIAIGKLREISMAFRFNDSIVQGPGERGSYFTFELEGGEIAHASNWVYRYDSVEDPPFRRVLAQSIRPNDFIFEMSNDLRANVESSLRLSDTGFSSTVHPERMLLKLYHDDVRQRCALLFKSSSRSALARELHAKMIEIDPIAAECRLERVNYWLEFDTEGDARPHASKDTKFFRIFCKALGVNDETAEQHWAFIRNARRLNQYLGRELVARYAEILFQPESAAIYRKVPEDVIRRLQQEALRCVYRVERILPPETPESK